MESKRTIALLFTFLILDPLMLLAVEDLCPVKMPVPTARKNLIVYDHNIYRSRIAKGLAIRPGEDVLPRGENMYKMEWSCELEKLAALAVKECQKTNMSSPYAVNSEYFEGFYEYGLENPYNRALRLWISALNGEDFTVVFNGDKKILPLANMIRANSSRIGCSLQRCGTSAAVACFYDSPNLSKGQTIYTVGFGCSKDGDCTTYPASHCEAASGLCMVERSGADEEDRNETVIPADAKYFTLIENIITLENGFDETNQTEITRMNSTEIPEKRVENKEDLSPTWIGMPRYGNRTLCPNVSGMTDEMRKRFLDAHNHYRSALAKGRVEWGNGTKLPAAADMVRLRYNCELEIYAFSYASTCSMENSDLESRVHTGENVGIVLEDEADTFEKAVFVGVRKWWKTVKADEYIISNDAYLDQIPLNQQWLRFLQMIWTETKEIGCAVVRCGANYFLVCRYYPRGNIYMKRVYKPGKMCTMCPWPMNCDYRTGLCMQAKADDPIIHYESDIFDDYDNSSASSSGNFMYCFCAILFSLLH